MAGAWYAGARAGRDSPVPSLFFCLCYESANTSQALPALSHQQAAAASVLVMNPLVHHRARRVVKAARQSALTPPAPSLLPRAVPLLRLYHPH